MSKLRNAASVLAMSAAAAGLTVVGPSATANADTGREAAGTCYVAGAFCGTVDGSSDVLTLRCGEVKSMPWSGGGYWNNRLPRNGTVSMAKKGGRIVYTAPANYGPVRGDWTPIHNGSLRANC